MSTARSKLIFKTVHAALGSPPREQVLINAYSGVGNNEGLTISIARFRDCPKVGLTTILSLGLNELQEDEENPDIERECYNEILSVIHSDMAEEFAASDFQYYAMAAAQNDWPTRYNSFGSLKSLYFHTSDYAILSPCLGGGLQDSFLAEGAEVKLLWFLPLLADERKSLASLAAQQIADKISAATEELYNPNRKNNALS